MDTSIKNILKEMIKMLNSILNNNVSNIKILSVLICSIVSLILGVILALTHKHTSKSNKSFLTTVSILPLLVEAVILMVSGDLGTSIATLGAFSLVKFRSLPGTSKEILIVFFAMTIRLCTGMGCITFAILITILGCLAIIIANKLSLFNNNKYEKILRITIPENLDYTNVFDAEFEKYTSFNELEQVKTVNMGSLFELNYKIILNKDVNEKEFIDELRIKNGNLKIILSHPLINSNEL